MTVGPDSGRDGLDARIAAAHEARGRADARLTDAIDDFFLADDARLDERTRIAVASLLDGIVRGIETATRRHAARVLSGRGADGSAEALLGRHEDDHDVGRRLRRAGLLRDRQLMDELIARVRGDIIAEALPVDPDAADQPSVLVRLADSGDGVVAAAARALLAADSRRRAADGADGSELPAELHHRLVWWIAASIREAMVAHHGMDAAVDRAIVEAAQRSLTAHDEGERAEAAAMRLASAIDPRADELAPLLIEALRDRRLGLFTAVLARALDLDFASGRAIVLEPEGDRLWLALRAAALDRSTIARIALALADADPRRDIERFADELDDIARIPVEAARSALAPLTLHHDLRIAIDDLLRERSR